MCGGKEYLAKLVKEDLKQRREAAKDFGVLAYGKSPLKRARCNENFLTKTLENITYANKKIETERLWSQSRSPRANDDVDSIDRNVNNIEKSILLAEKSKFFSSNEKNYTSSAVRGRGGVGSRLDDVGPFIDEVEDDLFDIHPNENHKCPGMYASIFKGNCYQSVKNDSHLQKDSLRRELKKKKKEKKKKGSKKRGNKRKEKKKKRKNLNKD